MIYGRHRNGQFRRKPSRWRKALMFVCYVGLLTLGLTAGMALGLLAVTLMGALTWG